MPSTMNEVLAFDWGIDIVGVLDVRTGVYTAYRGKDQMVEGGKRVVFAEGSIVSFAGNSRDLPKLFELLLLEWTDSVLTATHDDMLEITSSIRWPPNPGTGPINGDGLRATYEYYFRDSMPPPPSGLADKYVEDNWRDCYMTAELWKKWKRGELAR